MPKSDFGFRYFFMIQETENKSKKGRQALYGAIGLAWELGYMITLPLVVLAVLGRFLDKNYSTSPLFLIAGILLAIAVSGLLVFRKTKRIMDEASKQ
ncbi:MAG: AtpZ/AtpI family protein [Candidatus Nealsonbacteria bacterium]|nr:AtpZ/AtpI family protein [Candidatus Nealsonbacteria bacterium]